MKKIIFKNIRVCNFLSIGSREIKLDFTPGINLITGINLDKEDTGNGSGKSSLVNSIYFALYGRTLKDLKVDKIPNSFTRGPCRVTLDFDVCHNNNFTSYSVIRSLRPTKLKILRDGEDITKSTIIQTTELLQDIISCSSTVFENSIVMDANSATNFMSQKKVEKRKFLEGILNLTIFGEMLSIARADYNDARYQFDIENAKLQSEVSALDNYRKQLDRQKSVRDERREELQGRINEISKEMESLSSNIKSIPSDEELGVIKSKCSKLDDALSTNRLNYKKLIKLEAEVNQSKKHLMERLDKLINLPNECVECGRSFSDEDRRVVGDECAKMRVDISDITNKISDVRNQIGVIEDQYKKIEQGKLLLSQKQNNIKASEKHNETVNWRIMQLSKTLDTLHKDLIAVDRDDSGLTDTISSISKKVDGIRETVNRLNVKMDILKSSKFILSEEGIRSFIVKRILRILNSKLNMYLAKLDANTRCEFNEYFEESLWDISGNERSYYNFSNGEQRRIDLAILFAFQDIRRLQADVDMNISIYDELLDSSLDRRGSELVIALLKERADKNKECVYIVSHRKEAQSSYTNKVVTLQKKNGITTLVD
jgi:DNA repair exonuclease SbcCD ATPase subunit